MKSRETKMILREKKMTSRVQNYLIYTLTILICLLLITWLKAAPDGALKVLLYPHRRAAEIFYNINMHYYEGIGYRAVNSTYVIGRECMGYNFIALMFGMNACLFIKYFKGFHKAAWLLASFAGAIVIGILISCLRIIGSIPFVNYDKFALIHLSLGISMYFFTLTSNCIVFNFLFGRYSHEKIV